MAKILKETLSDCEASEIGSIQELMSAIRDWQSANNILDHWQFNRVWFRGHSRDDHELEPGVYRSKFKSRSQQIYGHLTEEDRILQLESQMLQEFRSTGARYLDPQNVIQTYFLAQHYGLPTRLLDWTTNPLAALFFAVDDPLDRDGELIFFNASDLIPEQGAPDFADLKGIASIRHPYAIDAIQQSFYSPHKRNARILPIRPDDSDIRIGQQSSCFTLHMKNAADQSCPSLRRLLIPAKSKLALVAELHLLNINRHTIYPDLQNLSTMLKKVWGV